jgi:c-di-GMP-related signal transduction protein
MLIQADPREIVYVARQPIVFTSGRVYGYELLYRAAGGDDTCTETGDVAGARVLTDSVLSLGLETLTAGRPAFFNLTKRLLLTGAATLLPPRGCIFELGSNIAVDDEVVEACRRLDRMGYSLALDHFEPECAAAPLLPSVKFLKVDVRTTTLETRRTIAQQFSHADVRLIAEGVESAEEADEARAAGYRFLQGYFFCRPVTAAARAISPGRLAYVQLMGAINDPDVTIDALEDLVKRDIALSYRVLRCINSAAFGVVNEITSIRQALLLLGTRQVRQWASVWALAGVNDGDVPETVTVALLRARCCEMLGTELSGAEAGAEFFLMGLWSLLDVILGRPMKDALGLLPLSRTVREGLLGVPNTARTVLEAVIAYERGEWREATAAARRAGISMARLPAAYEEALRWGRELSRHAHAA